MSLIMQGIVTYGHKWVVLVAGITCATVHAFLPECSSETNLSCNRCAPPGATRVLTELSSVAIISLSHKQRSQQP